MRLQRLLRLWILACACAGAALAQEEDFPKPPPVEGDRGLERLQTLSPALTLAEEDLEAAKARLSRAVTETEREELAAEVNDQRMRVKELRDNFRTLATGVEESRYLGEEEASGSIQESLQDILEPISRGVREVTAGPREMEHLRSELEKWRERRELSDAALQRLATLIQAAENPSVRAELEAARGLWEARKTRSQSQIDVFEQQIELREQNTASTWERFSGFFAEFWKSRGLNLLLAFLSAALVFIGVRRLYRWIRRLRASRGADGFATRAMDLTVGFLSGLLAIAAAILVFYVRGDWLLLAIAILAVLGVLWASKQALPPYLEQIRMILNIGPVRQGERLIYGGVPWRVDRLHFYCEFRNPELTGGLLRLPIRDVMPLHSRPAEPKEPWFPTHLDDWVTLDDGTYGKVVEQTPEQVVVLRLGGSRKTYVTSEFIEQNPENLSRGFRISSIFGIDYAHQPISTVEVPEVFQMALERRLVETVGRDGLRSVKVEFAAAGSSSLDYEILADFHGDVAAKRNVLARLLQGVCVDVCNERGWVIPFTQVTVHQAAVEVRDES